MIKDLESFRYGEGTGEAVQDRGLRHLFIEVQKAKGNIMEAFNSFITVYL